MKIYIYDIGSTLDDLKRYEEAIQMYDKVIQLNPKYSKAYNNKGWKYIYIYVIGNTLYNLKRYEEAIQMFDKAIQLNPQFS